MFTTPPVFYHNHIYIARALTCECGELPGRLVCIDPGRTGDISLEVDEVRAKESQSTVRRRCGTSTGSGERWQPWPFTMAS